MFIESARRNSAEVQLLDGEDAVPQAVAEFLRARQARLEIVCEEQLSALPWDAAGVSAAVRPPTSDDNCGATSILAAAADTGAMLMSDAQKHALTQSLLPPCHVAVLRAADIVPSMAALWRRLPRIMRLPRIYTALCGRRLPSPLPRCCVFVCGPSRTRRHRTNVSVGCAWTYRRFGVGHPLMVVIIPR